MSRESDFIIETGVVDGVKQMVIIHKRRDITDCLVCIHNKRGVCEITGKSVYESHAQLYNEKWEVCSHQAYYLPSGLLFDWNEKFKEGNTCGT